jgi:hypothetical protein
MARHQILTMLPKRNRFPSAKALVHFEGVNGPDGLPQKHAVEDEPYQFIDPKKNDGKLFKHVKHHLHNAHVAYKRKDNVKTAFELAWLSHMVIDGLTPAHHQPFKEQLKALDPREAAEIDGLIKRIFMPGESFADLFVKNWKRLGPQGVGTNHILFEAGIDFIVMPMRPKGYEVEIKREEMKKAKSGHFLDMYWAAIQKIAALNMFERYEKGGWTPDLAMDVRNILVPECVRMVTLAWYAAITKGR